MKILQLTRQFLPSEGGIESVVEGLSGALQKRGHSVQVATLRSIFATGELAPAESIESGVSVRRMRHWGSRRYPIAPSVWQEIRGYDLVHIHGIDFFVDFLSGLRAVHKIPIVVSTHGGIFHTKWLNSFKNMYFKTVTRVSLARVGAVVCVSQHDRRKFEEIIPPERIRVIENGANIDRFMAMDKKIEPGLILGISRLVANKRVHKVLEAMAPLRDKYPRMRLEWVGADVDGLSPALEKLASELGLEGRIRFHGSTTREDLHGLLQRAHVFVSASAYEGFGLSTIEAMSAATIPIVTAVGAAPDVITHGVSGFLTDPEAAELSPYMDQVLAMSAGAVAEMGAAARTAATRFSWGGIAPQYEQLYEEVLARAGGRSRA